MKLEAIVVPGREIIARKALNYQCVNIQHGIDRETSLQRINLASSLRLRALPLRSLACTVTALGLCYLGQPIN